MEQEIKKKQLRETLIIAGSVTSLLVLLIGIFIFAKSNFSNTKEITDNKIAEKNTALENNENPKEDPFASVKISAHGAYIKDLNTGKVLYSKNASEKMPLASLTKVVTALTAAEILEDSDLVKIDYKQANGNDGLVAGEHFRFGDLVNLTLISSSNNGASALAFAAGSIVDTKNNPEKSFVDHMNILVKKIGMTDTEFKNETGLDENNETEAGALGSAKDISTLFEYVLRNEPKLLEATRAGVLTVRSKEGFEHHLKNTNEIINSLPNIVGSKTGYTEVAGGNLAVVIDPALNNPVVIVVLGSSKEGRFKDVERLTQATLDYFITQE